MHFCGHAFSLAVLEPDVVFTARLLSRARVFWLCTFFYILDHRDEIEGDSERLCARQQPSVFTFSPTPSLVNVNAQSA